MSPVELLLALLLLACPVSALEPTRGHGEIETNYNVSSQNWNWAVSWYDDDLDYHLSPLETVYFPGYDRPTNVLQGIRNVRPAAPKWDFLGMAPGEPVWIFADTSWASVGYQTTPANLLPNLTFRLNSIIAPPGGRFFMFSGTTPNIYFNTTDGIDSSDVFVKGGSHTHVNWAFSKPGLWIVSLTVEGTVASTGAPTAVSSPQPLVFAIGGFARWQAERFTLSELLDSSISGDTADPDKDGWPNVLEYTLGGNPKSASAKRESDALPLAPRLLPPDSPGGNWKFRYQCRIPSQEADLLTSVQINTGGLTPQNWTQATGTEATQTIDSIWQQVTLSLDPSPGVGCVFFRLRVRPN